MISNFEESWNGLESDNPLMNEALNDFDLDQYRKDMEELKSLTSRILNNNPSYLKKDKKDTGYIGFPKIDKDEFGREFISSKSIPVRKRDFASIYFKGNIDDQTDKKELEKALKKIPVPKSNPINLAGNDWVGNELSKNIMEKSKEQIENDNPRIAKELQKLGLYGVYTVSDNKFDANYLDFIVVDNRTEPPGVKVSFDHDSKDFKPIVKTLSENVFIKDNVPTIEARMFSVVGRMQERFIPFNDKSIELEIKDFINDEFIRKIKEMTNRHKESEDEVIKNITSNIEVSEGLKDTFTKVSNRINMISNYINVKNHRGGATFIFASRKNINFIVEAYSGWWYRDGNTYKFTKTMENFNLDLVANDNLENTIIVGRCPKEGEVGLDLIINRNTLNNFQYTEDDISGVNLSFDFHAFGHHPESNYFSFDLNRQ
jgi:hypothetical protein